MPARLLATATLVLVLPLCFGGRATGQGRPKDGAHVLSPAATSWEAAEFDWHSKARQTIGAGIEFKRPRRGPWWFESVSVRLGLAPDARVRAHDADNGLVFRHVVNVYVEAASPATKQRGIAPTHCRCGSQSEVFVAEAS